MTEKIIKTKLFLFKTSGNRIKYKVNWKLESHEIFIASYSYT